MSEELEIEDALLQIRNKLQADGIKLWLPPYYKDGPCNEELEVFLENTIIEFISLLVIF